MYKLYKKKPADPMPNQQSNLFMGSQAYQDLKRAYSRKAILGQYFIQ